MSDSDTIIKFDTSDVLKKDRIEAQQLNVFKLVSEDHPVLREVLPEFDFKNPPVNPNEFASTLVETCKLHHGIGLSANQCGFKHRVFVMGTGDDYVAFFNPKLVSATGEKHMIEGCLSFPFLGLHITRPETIEIEYQDYTGEKRTGTYNGLSARCWLHELDHMNGIVYTSKVKPLALQLGLKKRNKIMKKLRLK
jgi:peptide deformylase